MDFLNIFTDVLNIFTVYSCLNFCGGPCCNIFFVVLVNRILIPLNGTFDSKFFMCSSAEYYWSGSREICD